MSSSEPAGRLTRTMDDRVARGGDRVDWSVSHAWAAQDPAYRRGMMAYVGRGGGRVKAENVTFFLEAFPPGCRGGLHAHTDAEEIYFILEGSDIRVDCEDGDETWSVVLQAGDLVSIPPNVMRQLFNEGEREARVAVIFGSGTPEKAVLSPRNPFTA